MKKNETGLTKLAVKIGGFAGRTSSAISRASTALKKKIMPAADETATKGKKAVAKRKTARKAASAKRTSTKRASASRKTTKKPRRAA